MIKKWFWKSFFYHLFLISHFSTFVSFKIDYKIVFQNDKDFQYFVADFLNKYQSFIIKIELSNLNELVNEYFKGRNRCAERSAKS